jgi:uncharacterized membrane protein HdeD (DUF308 family)
MLVIVPRRCAGSAPPDSSRLKPSPATADHGDFMIVLGLILLLIGFLTNVAIVWTIGIIALVAGLILVLLGSLGHQVGGRRHYW